MFRVELELENFSHLMKPSCCSAAGKNNSNLLWFSTHMQQNLQNPG